MAEDPVDPVQNTVDESERPDWGEQKGSGSESLIRRRSDVTHSRCDRESHDSVDEDERPHVRPPIQSRAARELRVPASVAQ